MCWMFVRSSFCLNQQLKKSARTQRNDCIVCSCSFFFELGQIIIYTNSKKTAASFFPQNRKQIRNRMLRARIFPDGIFVLMGEQILKNKKDERRC